MSLVFSKKLAIGSLAVASIYCAYTYPIALSTIPLVTFGVMGAVAISRIIRMQGLEAPAVAAALASTIPFLLHTLASPLLAASTSMPPILVDAAINVAASCGIYVGIFALGMSQKDEQGESARYFMSIGLYQSFLKLIYSTVTSYFGVNNETLTQFEKIGGIEAVCTGAAFYFCEMPKAVKKLVNDTSRVNCFEIQ